MDDIDQKIEEERRKLEERLALSFGEDSRIIAEILIAALQRQFGGVRETMRLDFLAALAKLPQGSKAKPLASARLFSRATDPHYRVILLEGGQRYASPLRFARRSEAQQHAERLVLLLRDEIWEI